MNQEKEGLARRLREAREYLGLSQEYAAQQTGISRPAISEIEAGRRNVNSLELKRLSKLYGRPVEYLLGEEVEEAVGATADPVEIKLRPMMKDLKQEDREEILRFVEYLKHRRSSAEG
jgi:transcriptional regulator with XRE-family HTH domain